MIVLRTLLYSAVLLALISGLLIVLGILAHDVVRLLEIGWGL